jgi:small subunit ribosomal protein S9
MSDTVAVADKAPAKAPAKAVAKKAGSYFYALGRRKSAGARIRLMSGKGGFTINDKTATDYFAGSEYLLKELTIPFAVVDLDPAKFDVTVRVGGGGVSGQADAIKLGLARSLVVMDENLKSTLKRADLLGRDPREKERKKFGLKKARKQRQFTKR